jgi:thymidylate synthase ThyX
MSVASPPLLTGAPIVTLRSASARPYDSAIAAARTCYSPRVVAPDEVTEQQRQNIGPLTFEGGHHTVYQHAHFEFGLENVSRQFVWSFLHSHPFYNSEQSSQRFVRLDEVRAHVPPVLGPDARAVYQEAVLRAWEAYRELNALLKQDTLRICSELRHLSQNASDKRRNKVAREAEKKAIEVARYVIPVAAFTSMVHTLSGIVLHRLWRMMRTGDAPQESVAVVGAMVEHVRALDASFFERVGEGPLGEDQIVERAAPSVASGGDALAAALDKQLGARTSLLVDYTAKAETTTADAVRSVMGAANGALSDEAALELVLNPSQNRYRLETLQLSVHSPLARALHHASYTFLKRLSHTADSQDQRHRMVPASRPLMTLTDTMKPDYVTPPLVAANARAQEVYARAMDAAWTAKNRLLDMGVPLEAALYLLPNAKALRFPRDGQPALPGAQVGDANLLQRAGGDLPRVDGRAGAGARGPSALGAPMGPPCVLRAGRITPTCTEGEHFCGVPVWRSFPDVVRPL